MSIHCRMRKVKFFQRLISTIIRHVHLLFSGNSLLHSVGKLILFWYNWKIMMGSLANDNTKIIRSLTYPKVTRRFVSTSELIRLHGHILTFASRFHQFHIVHNDLNQVLPGIDCSYCFLYTHLNRLKSTNFFCAFQIWSFMSDISRLHFSISTAFNPSTIQQI